ncbi:hypothetical protein SKAU_G00271420 [Synaphobranchus kaupii]|uniref:Endonuclease/exonuclease/phosphatase domain-containing protein n=1 Tax=Synaphobranchus kaupii TaxID=118154 RepID=A0A9Q1INL6_SYNKA|nr:hypothetical protein SKAU_G00271420 [Synaphobranchus kaupii]
MARLGYLAQRVESRGLQHNNNNITPPLWLNATQLVAYQLLLTVNLLPGLLPSTLMSQLGFPLFLLLFFSSGLPLFSPTPPSPIFAPRHTYAPSDLHALNNNHRLTTAAATAASNAGILSRRRYIHRGSGHNRHRTLHYPKGTNIPSLWTNSRPHVNTTHRTSNLSNLRSPPPAPLSITFALLNTRSLTNKSPVISELILDNNIDFLLLTETWQQPSDYYALNQATPTNYCYIAKPRSSGRGGGIAVLHKQSLSVTELDLNLPPISFPLPSPLTRPPPSSPDDYAILLDTILSDSLNSMAPWKTITVSFTTSSPWYTSELRTMKQTGRQLERLYKKTHLTVHAEAYKQHISSYRDALLAAKSAHYSTLINSTNRNPRILFSTVKTLLQPPDNNPPSSTDLCNSFLHSFNNKISQINTSLTASITNSFTPPSPDFHPPPP